MRTGPTHVLDLRVGYDGRINGGMQRRGLALEVFNALNTNSITAIHLLSDPAFGRAIDVVPPRILRFGATFTC